MAGILEIEALLGTGEPTVSSRVGSMKIDEGPETLVNKADTSDGKKDKKSAAKPSRKKKIVDEDDFIAVFDENGGSAEDAAATSRNGAVRRSKLEVEGSQIAKKTSKGNRIVIDNSAEFDINDINDGDDVVGADDRTKNESRSIDHNDYDGDAYDLDKIVLDNSVWGQKLQQLGVRIPRDGGADGHGQSYEDIFGVRFMKAASGGTLIGEIAGDGMDAFDFISCD